VTSRDRQLRAAERSLFVTGAAGLVGRRLLERLDPEAFGEIRLLARREFPLPPRLEGSGRVRRIASDLSRPERYAGALDRDTVVIHLAARTGNARPEEFRRDNVEGTLSLLEAAEAQDVAGLVHVSTIAVHFPETAYYPYAESKREAETLVRDFPCKWTIVRPTMVLGRESPIWDKLAKLAKAPLLVVPGPGATRIQPIHVDDLAGVLLDLAASESFDRGAHDLGGGEVVTVEDLLRRAHRRFHGRGGPAVRTPFQLGVPLLRVVERLSPLPLPVGEGQLSSFLYDGVVRVDGLQERYRDRLRSVEEILDDLIPRRGGRAS